MKFDTEGLYRKDFKTEEAYLAAVYKRNPIIRDKNLSKKQFTKLVRSFKDNEELSVTQAIKRVSNTVTFTPPNERAVDNFVSGLKTKYPGTIKELIKMTGSRDAKGHFVGFKKNELKWDQGEKMYVYMGKVLIDIKGSPESVELNWKTS